MRRYTVASLTQEIDRVVARHWPSILVEGELSQISTPGSGNAYLTLRHEQATLAAVVWRDRWQHTDYRPKVGERVLCRGRMGIYPSQGRYQLYVNELQPAGEGALQRRLEQIKARLEADGLLDPRRKRPLPAMPRVVGVATSLTGAALQDFIRVSRERWPAARVLVAGCTVQGADAAASVVRALELLFDDGRSDVIVVTRGGGSKLDLMPFQDEQLARWIATAPIPIVSAVGHEIDTTIADLVADAVAATPSAAALRVLPDRDSWRQRVDELHTTLTNTVSRGLAQRRGRLADLRRGLRHPGQRVVDGRARRTELLRRLDRASMAILQRRRHHLDAHRRQLTALSPLGVLDRGYSIVSGPSGVLRTVDAVAVGERISVRLARGQIVARVLGDDVVE